MKTDQGNAKPLLLDMVRIQTLNQEYWRDINVFVPIGFPELKKKDFIKKKGFSEVPLTYGTKVK